MREAEIWRIVIQSAMPCPKKMRPCLAPVAHGCNPSYSEGRDQEDRDLKPAWANSFHDAILKKTHHKKRAGGVVQGVGPEFKLQYRKKKRGVGLRPYLKNN
jgi:hypothetical protein